MVKVNVGCRRLVAGEPDAAAEVVLAVPATKWGAASGSPAAKRRCSHFDFDHGWALVDSVESMTGGAPFC